MVKRTKPESENVWPYVVWPPIVLNIGAIVLLGVYAFRYAASSTQAPAAIQTNFGQIQFALSVFIFLVEWFFALLLIYHYRRSNQSIWTLFSPGGNPLRLRWGPAILLFVVANGIFLGYILYLLATMPDLTYRDMNPVQIILFLLLTPLTAGFTEELIWRGHIITGFELRGKSSWAALLISAVSFALIHGVFLPDKLLVTLILGIVFGIYYVRERALVPLMFTHWLMDVWSFGIFFFR